MSALALLPSRREPPPPLPRCLASIELRRIAGQHGIVVEIATGLEETPR
jgi:hypothetical protein